MTRPYGRFIICEVPFTVCPRHGSQRKEGMDVAEVKVSEGESLDEALRKFKRKIQRAGILSEVRRREYYDKPSVKKKKKSEAARRRKHRRG